MNAYLAVRSSFAPDATAKTSGHPEAEFARRFPTTVPQKEKWTTAELDAALRQLLNHFDKFDKGKSPATGAKTADLVKEVATVTDYQRWFHAWATGPDDPLRGKVGGDGKFVFPADDAAPPTAAAVARAVHKTQEAPRWLKDLAKKSAGQLTKWGVKGLVATPRSSTRRSCSVCTSASCPRTMPRGRRI